MQQFNHERTVESTTKQTNPVGPPDRKCRDSYETKQQFNNLTI